MCGVQGELQQQPGGVAAYFEQPDFFSVSSAASCCSAGPRKDTPQTRRTEQCLSPRLAVSTRLGSSPMGSSPLGSPPVGTSPLGSSPLGSSPLGSSPLGVVSIGSRCILLFLWGCLFVGGSRALGLSFVGCSVWDRFWDRLCVSLLLAAQFSL